MAPRRTIPGRWLARGVLLGALAPLGWLGLGLARGTLGGNPVAELLNQFGLLALIFLIASLAPTPLKLFFRLTWPMRVRRLLGLCAFFYAALHLLTYVLIDRAGELATLLEDVRERPFISVGLLAFLLLVPLAVTSSRSMVKRLGFARWKQLHRLSYLAALLAVFHFVLRVKRDLSEPMAYGMLLLLLLVVRFRPSPRSPEAPAER